MWIRCGNCELPVNHLSGSTNEAIEYESGGQGCRDKTVKVMTQYLDFLWNAGQKKACNFRNLYNSSAVIHLFNSDRKLELVNFIITLYIYLVLRAIFWQSYKVHFTFLLFSGQEFTHFFCSTYEHQFP